MFARWMSMAVVLTVASPVLGAGVVSSGTSGYETISKGVVDLGLDNMVLVHYHSQPGDEGSSASNLYASYVVGVTPRYFITKNLALGLNINWSYQRNQTNTVVAGVDQESLATDSNFLGFLMANYYIRLGNSLFFKPGIGVGGLWGTRSVPGGAGVELTSNLLGAAGRVDLGFVFYATQHFNLKAGVDVLVRYGKETVEGAEDGETFLTNDVGVSAGLGYSF